jgi:prophage antirepressor-like protein
MEVIKAFKNELNVTIKGTYEKPLFRASDIGSILEISNTRSMTKYFDSSEKVVHTMHTLGGSQEDE